VLTGIYLGGLAWMTLTPIPFEAKRESLVELVVDGLHRSSATDWVTAAGIELAIKVAIFVPFGLLLVGLLGRRRWVFVVFLGVITSCWIELAQSIWVPSRAADAGDVLANSTGALLGVVVALVVITVAQRRSGSRERAAHQSLTPISQSPGSRL